MDIPIYEKLNCNTIRELYIKIHYSEFHQYIIDNYPKDLTWPEKLYWYYHDLHERPKCKMCNNFVKFINFKIGYQEYCCIRCVNSDPDKKEKVKQTNIKKYGGVAPACSKEVRSKMEQTIFEKYGVKYVAQVEEIKNRARQTNIERCGGCGNASEQLKKKQKQTLELLFGVQNYTQSEIFYEKAAKRHPDVISIDIKNKQFECVCPDDSCDGCVNRTYKIPIYMYHNRAHMTGVYKCTNMNPINSNGVKKKCTSIELFIRNILDRYNINYISNTRDIIAPLELDIYIPDKRIAIECNGIYYHNASQKDKNYHINKYELCKSQNIQLISIWEDWIHKKPNIIINLILSKLGIYKRRIFARKCNVSRLEASTSNALLDNYHLQGGCASNIKYGLYYGDELISVMTFTNHKNSTMRCSGWELVRFCTIANTQVIGGAEKLLTHFIRDYNPQIITSFSMNDISNGNLYQKLGFTNQGFNKSYWYIDNEFKRYHRSSFTKDSIVRRGWRATKDGWTESEVMNEMGYNQIYDSGQTKWVLRINQTNPTNP